MTVKRVSTIIWILTCIILLATEFIFTQYADSNDILILPLFISIIGMNYGKGKVKSNG